MAEYIDREALLAELESHYSFYADMLRSDPFDPYPLFTSMGVSHSMGIAKDIAKADVAPVLHGRWQVNKCNDSRFLICSECGFMRNFANKSPYCPNCGARMDGDPND